MAVVPKALTSADRLLWRLLIWVLGLATPFLASLKPRSFVGEDFQKSGGLSHLAPQVLYLFFLALAMVALKRRLGQPGKNNNQKRVRAFWVFTILLAAMPTLSSFISGSKLQWGIVGITCIYSATYFLPTPPLEWWVREVRMMLLVVFVYGSLLAAVLVPDWAWNSEYNLEASVALFPMRLFGTANHANSLAPLAVFAWMLGRFPHCRLRGDSVHGVAVFLVVLLAQSKTIWAITLVLLGVHVLVKLSQLTRVKKYFAYFAIGMSSLVLVEYLVTYSHYARKIQDVINDPQVATLTGRLPLWLYALEMWLEKPWIGLGLDAWSSKTAQENVTVLGWAAPNAHNQILQILSQSGLVGMGVMAIWALIYFGIARNTPVRLRTPTWWLTAFFFMPAFTEVILQYDIGPGSSVLTWIVFALIMMMGKDTVPGIA